MGFVCAICSEGLEKRPGTNPGDVLPAQAPGASKLSTTPCGHVFHTFCIRKWMSGGMANSSMCPCCRKPIPNRTCLPIYPDSYDDSLLMDQSQSGSQPEASDPEAMRALKAGYENEIQRLKGQLQVQREETDTQSKLYQLQCEEYHQMKNKFETEQHRSETFMVKFKRYESYKEMYQDMADKYTQLKNDIETYKHIQAHLDLSQIEVEQDLKIYSKYSLEEAIRKISGTKNMLQREIANLQHKREEERINGQRYLKETNSLRTKLREVTAREFELQSVVYNLNDEVKELRLRVKSASASQALKTGEEVNNNNSQHSSKNQGGKKTSRVVRNILDSTVLVADSDESQDEFDDDVGMISTKSLSRKVDKRPSAHFDNGVDLARSSTSSSSKQLSKRRAIDSVSVPATNFNLDDSDVIVCDSDTDSKDNDPLSPVEMKIKCSIPGVPPITPSHPLVAKKFLFKKPKTNTLRK